MIPRIENSNTFFDHRHHTGNIEYSNIKTAIVSTNIKRLVILGAAESGVGAAILAKAKGYNAFLSDNGSIKDKYKQDLNEYGLEWEENGHDEARILNCDLII